ncbi:MAG: hypothetical protein SVJ22_10320 [Halobacteriota archaeon]|nr:hypothetical protein [Halobacteriota archaeon]
MVKDKLNQQIDNKAIFGVSAIGSRFGVSFCPDRGIIAFINNEYHKEEQSNLVDQLSCLGYCSLNDSNSILEKVDFGVQK